jgi:hypothetical protein
MANGMLPFGRLAALARSLTVTVQTVEPPERKLDGLHTTAVAVASRLVGVNVIVPLERVYL